MTINYRFGDVDAHGATIPAGSASLEPGHQAGVRDELAAGDFWGGAGSVAGQEFITQPGRNFQMMCEHVNTHGQKLRTAHSYVTSTDSADRLQLGLSEFRNNGGKYHEPTQAIFATELEWAPAALRFNAWLNCICKFDSANGVFAIGAAKNTVW